MPLPRKVFVMIDLVFQTLDADATQKFLADIAPALDQVKFPAGKTTVQTADLAFYDNFKLCAVTDTTLPPPNTRYMLYKPGDVA